MDNDKQISPANIFLKDDLLKNIHQAPEIYDLNAEFSKTKNNKNVKLWRFTTISIGVLFLFILISSIIVEVQRNNIKININDFEDTNLFDSNSNSNKTMQDIADLRSKISDIQNEKNDKIKLINNNFEKQKSIINAKRAGNDIKDKQIKDLDQTIKRDIALINNKYNKSIEAKKKELSDLEKNLGKIDVKQLQEAKKIASTMDNQSALMNIEIEKVKVNYEAKIKDMETRNKEELKNLNKYYTDMISTLNDNKTEEINDLILKYNPKIDDSRINEIFNTIDMSSDINIAALGKGEINILIKQRNDLVNKLYEVQYTNSIPNLIKAIDIIDKKIISASVK